MLLLALISFPTVRETPRSTVWALNGIEGIWKSVSYRSKAVDSGATRKNENVVTAVAFTEGDRAYRRSNHLITGRLNGALYCGNKRLEKNSDLSPVNR